MGQLAENSYSGAGWAWESKPSRLASGMLHSGGPRAGAMIGGRIGSLKVGEDLAHGGRVGDEGDDAHLKRRRAGTVAARLHRCGRAAAPRRSGRRGAVPVRRRVADAGALPAGVAQWP